MIANTDGASLIKVVRAAKGPVIFRMAYPIKHLLVTDCDGCMTDGTVNAEGGGRRFSTFDGYINDLELDIKVAVVTHRHNEDIATRCDMLGWEYSYGDKVHWLSVLEAKYCPRFTFAFGNDTSDKDMLLRADLAGCPPNAHDDIKNICDIVTTRKGGEGAVREFLEKAIEYYELP